MLKNFKKNNNKGFTLVELLVVIAIMGILAVVAVPSLFKNIEKAKVADVTSYISAYKTAALSVYADNTEATSIDVPETDIDGDKPDGISEIKATVDTTNGIRIEVKLDSTKLSTAAVDKVEANFDGDAVDFK